MNRYVMEEFYRDPALRQRLFGEARRERARAVYAGLTWLARQAKAHIAAHIQFRPTRWIERLG